MVACGILLVGERVIVLVLELAANQEFMPPARLRQVLNQVPNPGPGDIDVAAASIVIHAPIRRPLEANVLDAGKAEEARWVGKAELGGKRLCSRARKLAVIVPRIRE